MEKKKKLPLSQLFGYVDLDNWTVYDSIGQIVIMSDNRCVSCKKSDRPRMFLDLVMIEDLKSPAYKGLQLHLGLTGVTIHRESSRKKLTKTRVNIYLSKDQAKSLYDILLKFVIEMGLKEK